MRDTGLEGQPGFTWFLPVVSRLAVLVGPKLAAMGSRLCRGELPRIRTEVRLEADLGRVTRTAWECAVVVGVLLGPVAIASVARGHRDWIASVYHGSVGLVCISAVGLAALDFGQLWWFVLVAAGSYVFAARAMLAIGSGRADWPPRAVRGFGGAYIALWTAIVIVSLPTQPIVWAVPTVVGILALERFAARVQRRPADTVDLTAI